MNNDFSYYAFKENSLKKSIFAIIVLTLKIFFKNPILTLISPIALFLYLKSSIESQKYIKEVVVDELVVQNELKSTYRIFLIAERTILALGLITIFTDLTVTINNDILFIAMISLGALKDGLFLYYEKDESDFKL